MNGLSKRRIHPGREKTILRAVFHGRLDLAVVGTFG